MRLNVIFMCQHTGDTNWTIDTHEIKHLHFGVVPALLTAATITNLRHPISALVAAASAECVDDSARDMCGEKNNDCLHGPSQLRSSGLLVAHPTPSSTSARPCDVMKRQFVLLSLSLSLTLSPSPPLPLSFSHSFIP